jgi:hypothetical protein
MHRRTALIALGSSATVPAWAQKPPAKPELTAPMGSPVPGGTGAGHHSPQSPIAPLKPRDDVVAWSTLTDIKTRKAGTRLLPDFQPHHRALGGKRQRLQGFMLPLKPGEFQNYFLLTSVPMTCSFCLPGGPESMVEVKATKPVRYSLEGVVVEGRFELLEDNQYGLYWRLVDAAPVNA